MVPLVLFAASARRIPLTMLRTAAVPDADAVRFLCGVLIFDEPMSATLGRSSVSSGAAITTFMSVDAVGRLRAG